MDMPILESEEYKGYNIEIHYDECTDNPRKWDPLTEIHYHSNRYTLGDTNHIYDIEGYKRILKEAEKNRDIIIPLYAYIHSGIALSLASFYGKLPQGHAEFDSGQCGTVIIRRKHILKEYGKKILTKALKELVYNVAKSEVEIFTSYLNGFVYEYIIEGEDISCGGFYDTEDDMKDAKSHIDYLEKENEKLAEEKVKEALGF